jgi:hypothetical protein
VENDHVTFKPEPKDWVKAMLGLHQEIWEGIDVDKFIQEERDSWDR